MSRKVASYHCSYENCTASFSRPYRLENHVCTHTGERPFVCEYEGCDKSYASSTKLKRHEAASHEGLTFKCTVEGCSKVLKRKDNLKKHIDNFHHKKKHKLYKCTRCNKEFNKHNWLKNHMFKHTGVFPYKCPIEGCEKGYLLLSRFKRHMKVHEGYKCKIPGCEKVFLKWSLYVTHLKEFHPAVHKCDFCEREFSSTSNLKTHSAIHKLSRTVFPCEMPNCTRFYFEEKNLNWHMRSYHNARPHVCDKENCHRAFKTKDALDDHMLRHIRRKPRKKKKPRPSFAAILSGCADPRKFTRKMPPKRKASESSDEFTTDEEIVYQDTSSEENTRKNSNSEVTDSDGQAAEHQAGSSHSNDCRSSKIPPCKCAKPKPTDVDSSYEELSPMDTYSGKFSEGQSTTPTKTKQLNQKSIRKLPKKCIKLESCAQFDGGNLQDPSTSAGLAAIRTDHIKSVHSHTGPKNKGEGESSSEYEIITVSVFGNVGNKSYSESDEVSSCLSEAEDLLNCNDLCSRREK